MDSRSNVIFTLDLEDHIGQYDKRSRYPAVARRMLSAIAARGVRGTVFAVGKVASAEPGLLREIVDLGHEVACHSLDHVTLDKQAPSLFRENTKRAKELLEDCTGQRVSGFRAPIFSLVQRSAWAVDILSNLGFEYSSSVMPVRNPLYGFPGVPDTPFVWDTGLIELPCPVSRIGPISFPYLGGVYLRYLPQFAIRMCTLKSSADTCLWTYCHPYDFDNEEPFARIVDAALWTSIVLWFNRRNTLSKILDVLPEPGAGTLGEWVQANGAALPWFHRAPEWRVAECHRH